MSDTMTWGEFKALVDKTVPDDTPIWYIDVSFPGKESGGVHGIVTASIDPQLGASIA
jgi:hypothetical protein